MPWQEILVALCLVMVIEGILPFLSPHKWRQVLIGALSLKDSQIRMVGLASMVAGALLLYVVR